MSVKIPKTNGASHYDINQCEQKLGVKLPEDYVNFLLDHDGAKPESNTFLIKNYDGGIASFIPIGEIKSCRDGAEGFPRNMIPIGRDDGGNLIYLSPLNGGVYFWDHETQDLECKIADNFTAFLAILKPFDLSQVKLKPGQLTSMSTKPDFREKFKKYLK